MREPARLRHHDVEQIAVHDQQALAFGADVESAFHHFDAAKVSAVIIAQEFVVVAGDVDQPRAFAGLAQQLLHDVVVGLRPMPGRAQRPAIDDIADQIDRVGFVMAEKIEELVGLTAAGAEMHIRNE